MITNVPRGGSRTATASRTERFVIIVNGSAVNYYYKELYLGCCSSPRSASGDIFVPNLSLLHIVQQEMCVDL